MFNNCLQEKVRFMADSLILWLTHIPRPLCDSFELVSCYLRVTPSLKLRRTQSGYKILVIGTDSARINRFDLYYFKETAAKEKTLKKITAGNPLTNQSKHPRNPASNP
jgi:hypothetical protein